jgi:hypothetical protein
MAIASHTEVGSRRKNETRKRCPDSTTEQLLAIPALDRVKSRFSPIFQASRIKPLATGNPHINEMCDYFVSG